MDPGGAPYGIFPSYPPDQLAQAPIDSRPPRPPSGLPPPERLEASAVPPKDRFRLHHLHLTNQTRPEPCHPNYQRSVTAVHAKTGRCSPQSTVELVAEEQVLVFQPAPRLEQVDNEHSKGGQDCQHRSQPCSDSRSNCESQP